MITLINMGYDHGTGLRLYELFPSRLNSLMLVDVMGIPTPKDIMFCFFSSFGLRPL